MWGTFIPICCQKTNSYPRKKCHQQLAANDDELINNSPKIIHSASTEPKIVRFKKTVREHKINCLILKVTWVGVLIMDYDVDCNHEQIANDVQNFSWLQILAIAITTWKTTNHVNGKYPCGVKEEKCAQCFFSLIITHNYELILTKIGMWVGFSPE